jgi:hypothetical protein
VVLVTTRPEDVAQSSELNPVILNLNEEGNNTLHGKIVEIVRNNSAIEVVVDVGFPVKLAMAVTTLGD